MYALMHLVQRTMGMAEKKPLSTRRHPPGQNVDQMKTLSISLEVHAWGRVQTEVIIAQNDSEFRVDCAQRIEDRFLADIAQVPDFVDVLEKFLDERNPSIMGVSDDSDPVSLFVHDTSQA